MENDTSKNPTLQEIMDKLDRIELLFLEKAKNVFTIDEAAKYIGVSKAYLYQLTSNHEIPYYKPRGKLIYFDRKELDEWMLQNRIKTNTEIDQEVEVLAGKRLLEKYLKSKMK